MGRLLIEFILTMAPKSPSECARTSQLVLQMSAELRWVLTKSKVGFLTRIKVRVTVGGFAEVKYRRTLSKVRPPVLVATS